MATLRHQRQLAGRILAAFDSIVAGTFMETLAREQLFLARGSI